MTSTDTTIDGPGTVTFQAGRSIQLSDFTVNAGATFIAENDARLAGITFDYDYQDIQYFLTQGDALWGELDWTYDRIGNRLSQVRTLGSEAGPVTMTDTYTYQPNAVPMANTPILDEITSSGGGTRNYTYGLAGHLEEVAAGINVIDFTSDAAGRLAGLDRTVAMEEATFTYDGRSFLRRAERPLGPSDQATTDPTYSSEGVLHCLTRQEDVAATPETVDYFYFAGRPVAQRQDDGTTVTWTFLMTGHLGTPAIATDTSGDEVWLGPFEPFGRDYLAGTSAATLDKGLFLRLPGQWEDGRWANASLGADLYYNVHRWYEHQVGRYARVDPLDNSLLISGVDIGALDLKPSELVRHQSLRGFDANNRDAYNYVKANPLYWVDVLGLDPCGSVGPPLLGCRGPGTGCCVLSCIRDLRAQLCAWQRVKPWLSTSAGILVGGAAGLPLIETGLGAVVAGAIGFGVGYTGGYFAFDAVVPFDAFRKTFQNCVNNHCGVTCRPDRPSFIDAQFATTKGEVFP